MEAALLEPKDGATYPIHGFVNICGEGLGIRREFSIFAIGIFAVMKRLICKVAMATGLMLCFTTASRAANNRDSIFSVLSMEIGKRDGYFADKEAKIASIRNDYNRSTTLRGKFDSCRELFDEYRCYQSDSAYHYAALLKSLATQSRDAQDVAVANMALMDYYTSVGFFKEAAEIKNQIVASALPSNYLPDYYYLCDRFFQNICSYVGGRSTALGAEYDKERREYLDSLISVTPQHTAMHDVARLEHDQMLSPSKRKAIDERLRILRRYDLSDHEKAVLYSYVGRLSMELGEKEDAKCYLAQSAIHDIRGNIRETTAAKMLAEQLFAESDIDRAYDLIHIAFDDAAFYNSHLRKDETSSIMRMIEVEKHHGLSGRMWKIGIASAVIFVLLVLTLYSLAKVRKRKREIEKAKTAVEQKSRELDSKNNELNRVIGQLHEVTAIKDEYIMQSLYLNTSFVNKVEERAHNILKLLKEKKYDELKFVPYEMGIKEERTRIYHSFDKAFLSLFPNFIASFNQLFKPEDRLIDDDAQELPVEVRIFALLRLGISDTKEVAKYLNLSVKTVYVYKTKIKSKSIVNNADFEDRVMAIPKV